MRLERQAFSQVPRGHSEILCSAVVDVNVLVTGMDNRKSHFINDIFRLGLPVGAGRIVLALCGLENILNDSLSLFWPATG